MKTTFLVGVLSLVGLTLSGLQFSDSSGDEQQPEVSAAVDDLALDDVQTSLQSIEDRLGTHSKELASISECLTKEVADIRQQLSANSTDDVRKKVAELENRLLKLEDAGKLRVEATSKYGNYPAKRGVAAGNGSTGGGGSTGIPSVHVEVSSVSSVQRSTPVRNAVAAVVAVPAKAVANAVDNYRARWTYPGELGHHLQTTHGQNVAGMTHADMLRLHDALHEGVSSHGSVGMQRLAPQSSQSECPDNVCPTPAYGAPSRRPLMLFPNLRRR